MKHLSKRQLQRIKYMLREKEERREKDEIIHQGNVPKYIEKHVPYVRKIAPNLDQLLIVGSFVSPPLKTGLIDRFLVLTELEQVHPLIVLNKADLLDDRSEAKAIAEMYINIGYKTLLTSCESGEGIEALSVYLKGKRTALAGHSGVGKSSLLNKINPDLQISVNDVSRVTNKGKHTTTSIRVYQLDEGTEVIDLPGIKLLDFVDINRREARFYFVEFQEYAERCKFRNCLHLSEIACAVKKAVDEGKIHPQRYESYCKFVESLN